MSDEIDGFLRLSKSDEHLPVNIGNPNEFTILECAQLVLKLTGSKSKIATNLYPRMIPSSAGPISRKRAIARLGTEDSTRTGPKILTRVFSESRCERDGSSAVTHSSKGPPVPESIQRFLVSTLGLIAFLFNRQRRDQVENRQDRDQYCRQHKSGHSPAQPCPGTNHRPRRVHKPNPEDKSCLK